MYSFVLIVEWLQGRCTASSSVLSTASGCVDLASPVIPEEMRNNRLALECQIWGHEYCRTPLSGCAPYKSSFICIAQDKRNTTSICFLVIQRHRPKINCCIPQPLVSMNPKLLRGSELCDSGDRSSVSSGCEKFSP